MGVEGGGGQVQGHRQAVEQPVQQLQSSGPVLFRRRHLEGGGQRRVVGQIKDLPGADGGAGQNVGPLQVPLLQGPVDHGQQGGLNAVGPVEQLLLQEYPGLLPPPLGPAQAGLELLFLPVVVGQLPQQLLRPVQLPGLHTAGGQGVSGPLPHLGIGAADAPLIEGGDLRLLRLPLRAAGLRLEGQDARQHARYVVGQLVAVRVLPQLVPGQLEGGPTARLLTGLVQLVQKQPDLLVGQVLLKGQQGVQVHPQGPGQGRQQGDVRVVQIPLPLVHCWGGHPQLLGQLLLGQAQGLPPGADHLVELHGAPSFSLSLSYQSLHRCTTERWEGKSDRTLTGS